MGFRQTHSAVKTAVQQWRDVPGFLLCTPVGINQVGDTHREERQAAQTRIGRLKQGHAGIGDSHGELQSAVFSVQAGRDKSGLVQVVHGGLGFWNHPDLAVHQFRRLLVPGLCAGQEMVPGDILGQIDHGVEDITSLAGEILAFAQALDIEHFVYQEIEIPAVDCLGHGFKDIKQ